MHMLFWNGGLCALRLRDLVGKKRPTSTHLSGLLSLPLSHPVPFGGAESAKDELSCPFSVRSFRINSIMPLFSRNSPSRSEQKPKSFQWFMSHKIWPHCLSDLIPFKFLPGSLCSSHTEHLALSRTRCALVPFLGLYPLPGPLLPSTHPQTSTHPVPSCHWDLSPSCQLTWESLLPPLTTEVPPS